ncbi:Gag-like protein [Agrocybe pediades]|nr:Gag-like protein [Agrocybe pediades]
MGTAYLDIWDSKSGSRAKKLINQSVMICGLCCFIREASAHVGTPVCQRCWKWGHSEAGCRQRAAICPHCMGPHRLEEHRIIAKCCKGNAKEDPPIPPTPADQDCPHKAHCVNCGGDHAASDRKCKFWINRYDRTWIKAKYQEVRLRRQNRWTFANSQVVAQ